LTFAELARKMRPIVAIFLIISQVGFGKMTQTGRNSVYINKWIV
jgi:hypothetical protein